jgi:hypothetical protein
MLTVNKMWCEKSHILGRKVCLLILLGLWAGYVLAAERAPGGKPRPSAAIKPACRVADFRALALGLHDPAERVARVRSWLLEQAKGCSLEKLAMIRDNRAVWLGTADTADLAALVDGLIEAQSGDGHEILKNLYGGSEMPTKAPG